jgi:RHS repeat-associated protein
MSAALAIRTAPYRACLAAKTRVRGLGLHRLAPHWAERDSSRETRWGNSAPLRRNASVSGDYHDSETDLFQNWNRFYDAAIGRYLEPEPALANPAPYQAYSSTGSPIVYGYAADDPTNFSDPSGLWFTADPACKNLPTEADCIAQADKIEDGPGACGNDGLRKCVKAQCKAAHLTCDADRVKTECLGAVGVTCPPKTGPAEAGILQ